MQQGRQGDMVAWLREASPYVHAHRGQTFVVYMSGAAVEGPGFEHHIYDLALLVSLGVRVVLVHRDPAAADRAPDRGRHRFRSG